jgi:hypothetical protein
MKNMGLQLKWTANEQRDMPVGVASLSNDVNNAVNPLAWPLK